MNSNIVCYNLYPFDLKLCTLSKNHGLFCICLICSLDEKIMIYLSFTILKNIPVIFNSNSLHLYNILEILSLILYNVHTFLYINRINKEIFYTYCLNCQLFFNFPFKFGIQREYFRRNTQVFLVFLWVVCNFLPSIKSGKINKYSYKVVRKFEKRKC